MKQNSHYAFKSLQLVFGYPCGVGEDFGSPLDCKEIQPVHPKGDEAWVFIGRTDGEAEIPILWPPDAKS